MTAGHTHLTPDLPPVVEIPDLPGAQRSGRAVAEDGESGREDAGNGRGAHHDERDGRHESAGQDSGG
ncbi:hypothetical protein B7P34_02775 [Streptosporangium nondiastaticum]|uniref:Uncharacterized protein n=2 Tax=Actinomycetes TaxID=1760 RepID=A0A9X7JUV6_9ACTN|nr:MULTISPECIES: hypothetical protein [Actinomycetes]PSJ30193.1 hypothetical protein B7P34_02775 [Streptosporangium nondiastaticum]WKU47968.1 hypothetical protein Q3V23_30095 [Streptomyces sp. VNUA116]